MFRVFRYDQMHMFYPDPLFKLKMNGIFFAKGRGQDRSSDWLKENRFATVTL